MNIAISALVAAPEMSLESFFQQAQQAAYDEVELALRPTDNYPFNFNTSDAELKAFRQMSQDFQLPISSITISPAKGNLLAGGQQAQESLEQSCWGLQCAARLGAKVALHTLGQITADLYYEDAYHNAVTALQKIAPEAEKLGVTLAVEFVWNGFLFSPLEMRRFLDEVNSPFIGFYFDPGNMAVFNFPQHWVRALGKRTKRVHLKDWQGSALNGGWTALQQGQVNFPVIMKELRQAAYQGPLVSEVPESLASWKETAQTMRKIALL